MMNKFFRINNSKMVIVVMIVVGGFLISCGKTTSNSSGSSIDLTTYDASSYGFTIGYPTGWIEASEENGLKAYVNPSNSKQSLMISEPSTGNESIVNFSIALAMLFMSNATTSNVSIGAYTGVLLQGSLDFFGTPVYSNQYFLFKDGKLYNFVHGNSSSDNTVGEEVAKSFKKTP